MKSGELCSTGSQCGEGTWCNREAVPEMEFAGVCQEKGKKGDECGGSHPSCGACESQLGAGFDSAVRCTGLGGEECEEDIECRSGICTEEGTCMGWCGSSFECEDGEVCGGDQRCYPESKKNGSCEIQEQCEGVNQLCDANTCTERRAIDADCTASFQCKEGLVCYNGACRSMDGGEAGQSCSDYYHCASGRCEQSTGECVDSDDLKSDGDDCTLQGTNINQDECAKGSFCRSNNPADDSGTSGTCTKQTPAGEACDRSLGNSIRQCENNAWCTDDPNHSGQRFVCPVVYTRPDEHLSCNIPVSPTFLGEYSNAAQGGPPRGD